MKVTLNNTLLALTIVAGLMAAAPVSAQPDPGTIGLRANLQNASGGFSVPIWMKDSFVFEPSFAVAHVSDVGTDYGIGVFLRANLNQAQMTSYVGFRVLGYFFSPETGDSSADYVYGPAFGGEYFFAESFSISVEAQLHYAQSDEASYRFANPDGSNIVTATAVSAAIYF